MCYLYSVVRLIKINIVLLKTMKLPLDYCLRFFIRRRH